MSRTSWITSWIIAGAVVANIVLGVVAFVGIGPRWIQDLLWKLGGGPPTRRPE